MRPRASFLAAVLLAAAAAGAAERVHLVPVDAEFGLLAPAPGIQAYMRAVRESLLGPSSRRSCEALVLPSFQREWSVHLQPAPGAAGQEVVCTIMQRQLWGTLQEKGGDAALLATLPRETWRFSAPLGGQTAAAWNGSGARCSLQPSRPSCGAASTAPRSTRSSGVRRPAPAAAPAAAPGTKRRRERCSGS